MVAFFHIWKLKDKHFWSTHAKMQLKYYLQFKKDLNCSQIKQYFFRCLDQKQCERLFSNARAKQPLKNMEDLSGLSGFFRQLRSKSCFKMSGLSGF